MGSTELQTPFISKTPVHGGAVQRPRLKQSSLFVRTIVTLLIVSLIVCLLIDSWRVDKPNSSTPGSTSNDNRIGSPVKNWDKKRREWLKHHPLFASGTGNRVLLVTGPHLSTCRNRSGLLKNKIDYCQIHGCDVLHSKLLFSWGLIRAAMAAHLESEWIWWVDPDAVFTDMDFKFPLERYEDHNLVVDGWAPWIYLNPRWIRVNHRMLLIRNCQWSMDFMEVWARMVPQNPNHQKHHGHMMYQYQTSCDQTAVREKQKWTDKIYFEKQFCFQGQHWWEIAGKLDINNTANESKRRECYGETRRQYDKNSGESWPLITNFRGCHLCGGDQNRLYYGESCRNVMERALNHADDQVVRNFGFRRP